MDLNVPFSDKDEAKRLGAGWNPSRRTWYIPPGRDPQPFAKWLPAGEVQRPYGVFAYEAYLVTATEFCWRCGDRFTAIGFLLAPGLVVADGPERRRETLKDWAFIEYATRLAPDVARVAQKVQPAYREGYSRTTNNRYWANHCPSCQALQGDFHLYSEPDGAFWLGDRNDAARMRAERLPFAFGADAGLALGSGPAWSIPGVRTSTVQPMSAPSTTTTPPRRRLLAWLGWHGGR
ncbi:hypothetical protein HF680_04310 [Brevundimonas sp. WCHBH090558]|uniref:DUF5710 domain-containing protein n=1 Tax=Brevundimonas huaxiensis TaxID=2725493 RepID=UPI001625E529|nr:DUF5710 domain-containing protein [Brevundimonas huaxiensis]MBC1181878.1 hypothetical protein [Brevundimonas huaxiensis]